MVRNNKRLFPRVADLYLFNNTSEDDEEIKETTGAR